jgi:integrase
MRDKLTAKSVENIKPLAKGRLQLWDAALPGFGLRVTEKGKKSWVVMYRHRDRQRRMTIGSYPAFSLADAREEARAALRAVERGEDPAEEKLAAKRKPPTLFSESANQFIELYAKPKNRGWKETRRLLKNNVEPHFKYLSIHDITRHHVIDVLDGIIARGAPTQANRTLAAIRKLYNWSMDRGVIDHNPVTGLKPPGKEIARDRVLTDDELKKVWAAWDSLGWPFGPICKLLLVTGQRRSEVAGMKWSDIDFDRNLWTTPREIAKNDRTHDVPLSPMATEILKGVPRFIKRDLIFSTNGHTPVSGFGRPKKLVDEKSGVTDWRLHDLRRTAASGMARLGVAPHVVEKILNHSSGIISGVAAVYNRHGYEEEKREALNKWAEALKIIDLQQGNEKQKQAPIYQDRE